MHDAVEKRFRRGPNPETYARLSDEEKDLEFKQSIIRLQNLMYQTRYSSAAGEKTSPAPGSTQK
jgi:hypothetical protein